MPGSTENTPHPDWVADVQRVATAIRRRVLGYVIANNGGYLSQACSSAEMLATLYLRIMRLGPSVAPMVPGPFAGVPRPGRRDATSGAGYNGPRAPELDRFVFSPVHYALVLYSALIEVGRMAPEGLDQFNRDGSRVEMIGAEHSPGHEVTAGSLGQALSQAGGIALARKLKGDRGRVWVFMSDGELQEGQTWEAFSAASFHRLTNLGVFIDANGYQCDGDMDEVMNVEPLLDRLRAFGVDALSVDGHDIAALAVAAERWTQERPLVIVGRTDPCRGLDVLRSRAPRFHYVRFKSDAERRAYEEALERL